MTYKEIHETKKQEYFRMIDRKKGYLSDLEAVNQKIDAIMWDAEKGAELRKLERLAKNLHDEIEGLVSLMQVARNKFNKEELLEMRKEYYKGEA